MFKTYLLLRMQNQTFLLPNAWIDRPITKAEKNVIKEINGVWLMYVVVVMQVLRNDKTEEEMIRSEK